MIISNPLMRSIALAIALFVVPMAACEKRDDATTETNAGASEGQPVIEASPIAGDAGRWKIVSTDSVTFSVTAPGAQRATILYRPVAASDQYIELKSVDASSNAATGEFTTKVQLPADFAGDVWAETYYPDGTKKDTDPISLATVTATDRNESPGPSAARGPEPLSSNSSAPDRTDKSALSDEITGGTIWQASFQAAQSNIKITVNVPAFQLCLWQNGELVKTYEIGVGRQDFPIDISNRKMHQIIFNPEWVPPNSPWVNKDPKVTPGEHISASDRRNPLGKIKIPLGDGYLIHQAEKTADIGHLVSHGCIRMQEGDLIDLAQKIISAESVPLSQDQIQHALDSTDRMAVSLKSPVPISISYDTLVVQQGILHVYPDVYNRGTDTVQNARATLSAVGVDTSAIDDRALLRITERANKNDEYIVSAADVASGNGLLGGHDQPLTTQNAPAPSPRATKSGKASRHARRSRR